MAKVLKMATKVTLKVLQYKVADSLDKVRLPSNPRALVTAENNAGLNRINRYISIIKIKLISVTV